MLALVSTLAYSAMGVSWLILISLNGFGVAMEYNLWFVVEQRLNQHLKITTPKRNKGPPQPVQYRYGIDSPQL